MSVPGSHPALFWPGATVSKSVSLIFEGPYESQRKFILSGEGALLWVILSYLQTEAAAEDTQVWLFVLLRFAWPTSEKDIDK